MNMSSEVFKMMLRQMFQYGEIEIKVDFENKLDEKYSVTTVFIDGKKVYENKNLLVER